MLLFSFPVISQRRRKKKQKTGLGHPPQSPPTKTLKRLGTARLDVLALVFEGQAVAVKEDAVAQAEVQQLSAQGLEMDGMLGSKFPVVICSGFLFSVIYIYVYILYIHILCMYVYIYRKNNMYGCFSKYGNTKWLVLLSLTNRPKGGPPFWETPYKYTYIHNISISSTLAWEFT